jgi:hypothetical protein
MMHKKPPPRLLWLSVLLLGCSGPGDSDTPVPVEQLEALTWERAANITYLVPDEESIHLKGGRWEGEPYAPGGASRPSAGLKKDFMVLGDLTGDGQSEAAVVLWQSSGGSGTFNHVAVVGHANGEIANFATAPLGDRVKTFDGRIIDGTIQLEVLQHDDDDPACCPTQRALRTWEFQNGVLLERPAVIISSTKPLSGDPENR